ncbi:transposase [Methanocalculus taiwanensis]|uniref:Transposase n=1 Tax=Methanocalculus taiwanensis TaxID=106207 RepID=A0ABD4TKL6_9EURY|nr:transposase [Methanocalculus taiwanensis]
MSDSDHPYKRLFSHKEMMADLISGFLNPEFAYACDFETLKRCNGSYVTDDLREREDDLIWSVRYGDRTLVIYLLIEFQSTPDPTMPIRIMSYMALLWQDLIRTGQISSSKSLPGIIPVVLYNGESPWNIPDDIGASILMPDPVLRFKPSVQYLVVDELRLSVHHLVEVRNLAASLFGLEQSSKSEDLFELGKRLNAWMRKNPNLDPLRRDFSLFFENTLKTDEDKPLPNPFCGDTMLKEKVKRWTAELKAEGKVEGKVEERRTLLRRMKAFGMSISEIAEITGLPEEEIRHLI